MVAYDCYLFRMKRLAKRLLSILLTIIVVSLIVFLLQEYALGDSASYILSEDAGGSAADIFRASVSADGSLMERYISFLQAFLSGRWGNTVSGQDIAGTIADRAGATLSLAVFSVLLSVLISVPVSLVSVKPGKFPDRAASFLSVIILSLPSFLTSFFLIILFSFLLGILPPAGYVHPSVSVPGWIRTFVIIGFSFSGLRTAWCLSHPVYGFAAENASPCKEIQLSICLPRKAAMVWANLYSVSPVTWGSPSSMNRSDELYQFWLAPPKRGIVFEVPSPCQRLNISVV